MVRVGGGWETLPRFLDTLVRPDPRMVADHNKYIGWKGWIGGGGGSIVRLTFIFFFRNRIVEETQGGS